MNHCIEICNRLLRGERSAVESYDLAIAQAEAFKPELAIIRAEHDRSVAALIENVRSMGGTPDAESGPWGEVATSAGLEAPAYVQGTANAFGTKAALEVLKIGEQAGKRDYENALEALVAGLEAPALVMADCKTLQSQLLARVDEHIAKLEYLQAAA